MATETAPGRTRVERVAVEALPRTLPVKLWAVAGGLILAFEGWVLLRWVTGPYFKTVPSGPSEPPGWMKLSLTVLQVSLVVATIVVLYVFVVRPWRRDGTIGVDAMFVIAFQTMWFQDPISNYFGLWFTYNSWMVNFGSWVNSIPGWMAYGEPGRMLAVPIVLVAFAYAPSFKLA